MENQVLGVIGAVLCLALCAVGSVLGTSIASLSAVGAWKKCYAQDKPAPFILLALVGFPLSQTLYGMILMFLMFEKAAVGIPLICLGILAGFIIGLTAYFQGKVGAAAADSQAETGQGLANYFGALGIIETVAIFMVVFTSIALRQFG